MNKMIDFKIGCSGYYNRHWSGIFYPEELPSKNWLDYYSEQLNSLELNSTFYKFPTTRVMQNWYKKSPGGFTFSVKAPKFITHINKFNNCRSQINDFYVACKDGLQEKLGCLLFQLPPSLQYSKEKLEQIIASLYQGFKNVVEFRHPTWWREDVFDLLKKAEIIFCIVSHPTMPPTLVTNLPTSYIRLHGTPQMFYSNYPTDYLKDLYELLLTSGNTKEAYIYFNNTAGNAGILNAQEMKRLIIPADRADPR